MFLQTNKNNWTASGGPKFAQKLRFTVKQSVLRSRKYFFRLRLRRTQNRVSAPVPAPAPESFIKYLVNYLFDLNKIKTVKIYRNFFSNHDFFL